MARATQFENHGWVHPEWTVTVSPSDEAAPCVPETATDTELVHAARSGSREAFDVLVVRHRRGVYHLCARYAASHEDAADLAQDAFLRAYRALPRFKGDAAFKTWLFRIAVNVCLNHVSTKAPRLDRMVPIEQVDRPASPEDDPSRALIQEERARRVRAAIARLPPKQRSTVILRVYQDLSHEEIARVLGSSVGACKANLFHALKKLRGLLEP
jgi:RNA polymerase sigma-70 factor (ECF subfamily)